MLKAAARRFLLLLGATVGVTALGALLFGALAGSSALRSISLGFYIVGSFLVIAGFFIGNRGPVRAKDDRGGFLFLFPTRRRWATAEEQATTINDSAIFIVLGFLLIMLGVAADTRYDLF